MRGSKQVASPPDLSGGHPSAQHQAMSRVRLDSWRVKGVFLLILAMLVYGPLATGAVRTYDFLVVQILGLGAALFWLVELKGNAGSKLYWPHWMWGVAAIGLYAIGRYWQSPVEYYARQELVRVLFYLLIFLVVFNALREAKWVPFFVYTFALLGMLLALYAIYQFGMNSNRVWHLFKPAQYLGRGSGTYINPNHLAGFIGLVLPLAVAFVLKGRTNSLGRMFLLYASLTMLAGLLSTFSYGGWLAVSVALIVLCLILARAREHRVAALTGAGFFTVLTLIATWQTNLAPSAVAQAMAQEPGDNLLTRVEIWKSAAAMWRDHAWWGVGLGQFDVQFSAYRPAALQSRAVYVHNDYLQLLVEWGVVGFILVLGTVGLIFWKVIRTKNSTSITTHDVVANQAAFRLGLSAGLVALAVHSLVEFNFQLPANALLAVTWLALLAGRSGGANQVLSFDRVTRQAVAIMVLCMALFSAGCGFWRWAEQGFLDPAEATGASAREAAVALQRAAEIDAQNPKTFYTLGETYRLISWQGNSNYAEMARRAIEQLELARQLNPFDPWVYVRLGMCHDWLDKHETAEAYFLRAKELDPQGALVAAHVGWHYWQAKDRAEARRWFEYSLRLKPEKNPTAAYYLNLLKREAVTPP